MNERILIIEDDQQILKLLQRGLAYEGYTVDTATDGRMGLILARDHTPDLVILDWMLPGMDGLEVCHRLRTGGSIPILMLTAKDTVQDRIQGLDAGADDYMIKPFNLDELLARVRSLLRRVKRIEPETNKILSGGDFFIDLDSRLVTVRGKEIRLTPKEYDLLVFFMRNPGKVLTQRTLLSGIWGVDYTSQPEYLRVFVNQLRKKIEPDPLKPQYILTDPWIGYRFKPCS